MARYSVEDMEKIVEAVAREVADKKKGAPVQVGAPLTGSSMDNRPSQPGCQARPIPVEISARHVHLTKEAVEKLFGKGYELTKKKDLSQPGEFLSGERVKIVTQRGEISNVAVLGPPRPKVQVELSRTDCRTLGIDVPCCLSGDLEGGGDMLLIGPVGIMEANECTIVAQAHVHMTPADAAKYGVEDGQELSVSLLSKRPITLDSCIARVTERSALAVHIDFDEANAGLVDAATVAVITRRGGTNLTPGRQGFGPYKDLENAPCYGSAVTDPNCKETGCEAPKEEICEFKGIKLINEDKAIDMAKSGKKSISIPKGIIMTPAAKDVFTREKIEIVMR